MLGSREVLPMLSMLYAHVYVCSPLLLLRSSSFWLQSLPVLGMMFLMELWCPPVLYQSTKQPPYSVMLATSWQGHLLWSVCWMQDRQQLTGIVPFSVVRVCVHVHLHASWMHSCTWVYVSVHANVGVLSSRKSILHIPLVLLLAWSVLVHYRGQFLFMVKPFSYGFCF